MNEGSPAVGVKSCIIFAEFSGFAQMKSRDVEEEKTEEFFVVDEFDALLYDFSEV
jgi:hypothetical protein